MEIAMTLPLDDGFLRRECPSCYRQFKWFSGATEEKPDDADEPEQYFCPYCGESANTDAWWTAEQLEYAKALTLNHATRRVKNELQEAVRPLKKTGLVSVSLEGGDATDPPPLHEPTDW